MFWRTFRCGLLAMALMAAGACSKRPPDEERLRALVAEAKQAIEKKEIGGIRKLISESYTDSDGRDRRAVEAILRLHLLRNDSVHLLTRISTISLVPSNRADVVVYVAMAAQPLPDADKIGAVNASLYRFEFTFAEENKQWRLTRAAWRRAEPADFVLLSDASS